MIKMYKPETTFANGMHPLGMVHFFKPKENVKPDLETRLYGKQLRNILNYITKNGPVTSAQVVKALDLVPSAKSQIRDAKARGLINGIWGTQPHNNNRLMFYSGVQ